MFVYVVYAYHVFLHSMYIRVHLRIRETHCVSCQSRLPFYPHDSRLTLEAMQNMHTK